MIVFLMYLFINLFLDNKMSISEECGAFKGERNISCKYI